jgi:hypothetical protein
MGEGDVVARHARVRPISRGAVPRKARSRHPPVQAALPVIDGILARVSLITETSLEAECSFS